MRSDERCPNCHLILHAVGLNTLQCRVCKKSYLSKTRGTEPLTKTSEDSSGPSLVDLAVVASVFSSNDSPSPASSHSGHGGSYGGGGASSSYSSDSSSNSSYSSDSGSSDGGGSSGGGGGN